MLSITRDRRDPTFWPDSRGAQREQVPFDQWICVCPCGFRCGTERSMTPWGRSCRGVGHCSVGVIDLKHNRQCFRPPSAWPREGVARDLPENAPFALRARVFPSTIRTPSLSGKSPKRLRRKSPIPSGGSFRRIWRRTPITICEVPEARRGFGAVFATSDVRRAGVILASSARLPRDT